MIDTQTSAIPQWNAQQAAALTAVATWLADPNAPQVFRLFGYAGTGKTTLARHLAAHVSGIVLFAAYTGKAASVLRDAGCAGASTLHSLLYHVADHDKTRLHELEEQLSERRADANFAEEDHAYKQMLAEYEAERKRVKGPKFRLNPDSVLSLAALLVIDECSMVDRRMGDDILSFGRKVLILGDPAQLPPVKGGGFFTNAQPDILLTEIHRQAADNPIVRWATLVRNGGVIPYGDEGLAKKFRRERVSDAWLAKEAGQLLCGKNDTRQALNRAIRKTMGYTEPYPYSKERLVCLKNDHELGLLNGVTCTAAGKHIYDPGWPNEITQGITYEGVFMRLEMDAAIFLGKEPISRYSAWFDYGYCLTVHKAQGSQWPTVTVYDDGFAKREPAQRQRWLYTAITRAQTQLHIVTS
jgi:exodeoxyribonuclease V